MSRQSDIDLLERRYRKWSGLHSFIFVPATLLAVFSLPVAIANHAVLYPFMVGLPLVLILVVIYGQYRAQKWEASARRRIAAYYHEKYFGTRWLTPAAAEGVVVEVKSFGRLLSLAFANGVTETYARDTLTEKQASA